MTATQVAMQRHLTVKAEAGDKRQVGVTGEIFVPVRVTPGISGDPAEAPDGRGPHLPPPVTSQCPGLSHTVSQAQVHWEACGDPPPPSTILTFIHVFASRTSILAKGVHRESKVLHQIAMLSQLSFRSRYSFLQASSRPLALYSGASGPSEDLRHSRYDWRVMHHTNHGPSLGFNSLSLQTLTSVGPKTLPRLTSDGWWEEVRYASTPHETTVGSGLMSRASGQESQIYFRCWRTYQESL